MAPKKQHHIKQSWRCRYCWRLSKETESECGGCKGWWEDVYDPSYVHKPPQQQPTPPQKGNPTYQQDWSWDPWPDSQGSAQTDVRQRSTSRRTKGRKPKSEQHQDYMPTSNPFGMQPLTNSPFLQTDGGTNKGPNKGSPMSGQKGAPKNPVPASADTAVDQETLEALRESYPDINEAPPRIRQIIEKAEKAAIHKWQADMQSETAKLAKAKTILKDIYEAKEQHRSSWINHLRTSAVQWKEKMEAYQKQQAHFSDLIRKTKKDIREAGDTVEDLNKASKTDPEKSEGKAGTQTEAEKMEIEKELRSNVQKILQDCIDLTMDSEPIDVEVEDTELPTAKRARSVEPGTTPGIGS